MRACIALLILSVTAAAWQAPAPKTAVKAHTKAHAKKKPRNPAGEDGLPLELPVLKLTVEGNKKVASEAILRLAGVQIGDKTSKEAFEAARQKLADSGFFDSVGYEYQLTGGNHPGYAAKFLVNEIQPLYPVEFAGFAVKSEELNAYLASRDPLYNGFGPPTQMLIDRWAKFLEAWMASKNTPKKIVGKIMPISAKEFAIQMRPDEPLPAVARVEFTGNEAIDSITLQNTIGAVAYGLPYTEHNFREMLDHQLRPLYEARGYMDPHFENIETKPAPLPVKGVLVNVRIVEGAVYKLGKVRFTGVNEDDQEALLKLTGLKPGETANFDTVNEAAEKVKRAIKRSGFYRATTEVNRKLDPAGKKIDVTFQVVRGIRYSFQSLTIQGLDIEGEAAIRKLWGEKPGDPYNSEYPEHFLSEVKDMGIFDYLGEMRPEVKVDDEAHTATVTLVFKPAPKKPAKKRGEL